MKRPASLYLTDILEAIGRIAEYLNEQTFEQFSKNTLRLDAVVRNFEIIGEATKNISAEVKEANPQIPWKEMAGMRDKLAHEYFGVDVEILWRTAKIRSPALKPQIEELLQ